MMPLANGHVQLTVTNAVDQVEIYATTVWHTSSVAVVTWTNDLDEVVTSTNELWHAVSPSFGGIESDWVLLTSSLGTTNGVGVYVDTDIPAAGRIRMYAAAQRMDTDGDGISDGEEIFLHRTDPLDPADFPTIPELEAALAGVNTAQLWYLAFLSGEASLPPAGPLNYAQRIQQERSTLEGILGSFLDLGVNPGGVLAEGPEVVTWTLPSVLATVGNSSGTWLGGMASAAHFQEIEAVRGQLTHLVDVAGEFPGYPHASVPFQQQEWMVRGWDLGTGYPQNWPHSLPISTYLLFHEKVSIPSVGDGTIDDWIMVNGVRFPSTGYIYTNHVANISAPIWNANAVNTNQLWDCGNCAGTNNHAYLSPFSVVHVMEVPILKVEIEVDESDEDTFELNEESGAQQFVTVKGTGNVVLRANVTPNTPEILDILSWQGATQDPSDPTKATLSRTSSTKADVSVSIGGHEVREAVVWVVWADISLNTTGPTPDESRVGPEYVQHPLGPFDYGAAGIYGSVEAGANQRVQNGILIEATITPNGFSNRNGAVSFNFIRLKKHNSWSRVDPPLGYGWNQQAPGYVAWSDDGPHISNQDVIPSADDRVFNVDGPGRIGTNSMWEEYAYRHNFLQHLEISIPGAGDWLRCSDVTEWHSAIWIVKGSGGNFERKTTHNSIGPGHISISSGNSPP